MLLKIYCFLLFATALSAFTYSKNKVPEPANKLVSLTPEMVLTRGPLQLSEIRFLQKNVPYYYKRGASVNTADFDDEWILFRSDNTGTYYADGNTYTLIWKFLDATKTKIEYQINYPVPMTVNWEEIRYTDHSVNYTEYYSKQDGTESLAVGHRVPASEDN